MRKILGNQLRSNTLVSKTILKQGLMMLAGYEYAGYLEKPSRIDKNVIIGHEALPLFPVMR